MRAELDLDSGFWTWRRRHGEVEIRFLGQGPHDRGPRLLAAARPVGTELAWSQQIHSDRVLTAVPGRVGEGDALVTRRRALALAVVTADCVPVLLAGPDVVAAAHAGWRGVASGVVPATVGRMEVDPEAIAAWLGPAIGPCCYEVGADVADRVAVASSPTAICAGAGDSPHLDLHAAIHEQLTGLGVFEVHRIPTCTRCQSDRLWSYRRQGVSAGRNVSLIWRPDGESF